MSRQVRKLEDKDNEEIDIVTFDFAPGLSAGENITSVVSIESEVRLGEDINPDAMMIGSSDFIGSRVTQTIGGGVPGCTYVIRCKVMTNWGRVLVLAASLRILHL